MNIAAIPRHFPQFGRSIWNVARPALPAKKGACCGNCAKGKPCEGGCNKSCEHSADSRAVQKSSFGNGAPGWPSSTSALPLSLSSGPQWGLGGPGPGSGPQWGPQGPGSQGPGSGPQWGPQGPGQGSSALALALGTPSTPAQLAAAAATLGYGVRLATVATVATPILAPICLGIVVVAGLFFCIYQLTSTSTQTEPPKRRGKKCKDVPWANDMCYCPEVWASGFYELEKDIIPICLEHTKNYLGFKKLPWAEHKPVENLAHSVMCCNNSISRGGKVPASHVTYYNKNRKVCTIMCCECCMDTYRQGPLLFEYCKYNLAWIIEH